jgi:hypothetical protein
MGGGPFCGRRRRVIFPILARTSNHVKSLFLLARVRGLPQRIDVQPLLIQGFLLGIREKV